MKIELKKCIDLYNARIKIENKESVNDDNIESMNFQQLGKKLNKTAQYGSIAVTMHLLKTGQTKTIKLRWIDPICQILGVDPNFMFGYPSVHDEEYRVLLK
jgi:DNA-binding Xre family transcriptional regulator